MEYGEYPRSRRAARRAGIWSTWTRLAWIWLLAALLSSGCDRTSAPELATSPETAGRLAVAVSVAPHAWLVEEIGGERVDVAVLVQAGESPATFQPSDAEVSRVTRSRIFFRTGVPFENGPWFEALAGAGGPRVVDLRQSLPLRPIEGHAHDGKGHDGAAGRAGLADEDLDPHVWLSPPLLQIQARTMTAVLTEQDPAHKDEYAARLAALEKRLESLDRELETALAPLAGRAFFVFHPVWGYFADRYDLRQVAIEVAGREPTDRELTVLQERARREGATVVFVQPQIKSRAAPAVAAAIGGRVEVLDPLRRDVEAGLREVAQRLLAAGHPP